MSIAVIMRLRFVNMPSAFSARTKFFSVFDAVRFDTERT
jgi:hypothetical protein